MKFAVTGYTLAKINLVKTACPSEIKNSVMNTAVNRPIVVERNRGKFGYIEAADFFPPTVIVAGADTRSTALKHGTIYGWALVENGTLEDSANDLMCYDEMLKLLKTALAQRYYGHNTIYAGQEQPDILQCHPFDGICIYAMRGITYAQRYTPDNTVRRINLIGESINATAWTEVPLVPGQTGARYSPVPMYPALAVSSPGAPNSELLTCLVRDWADIEAAVKSYLDASKGLQTPRFQPVALDYGMSKGQVVGRGDPLRKALVKAGVDPWAFTIWSADSKNYQVRRGKKIPRSKFAYAPAGSPPSKWKLPLDTPGRKKDALARINQTHGIPSGEKSGILQKVRRAAGKSGISVSDKPTSGQKKWAHSGKKVTAGGPGSGRHSEGMTSYQKSLHDYFVGKGYKHTGQDDYGQQHYDNPNGEHVIVERNGTTNTTYGNKK